MIDILKGNRPKCALCCKPLKENCYRYEIRDSNSDNLIILCQKCFYELGEAIVEYNKSNNIEYDNENFEE